MAAFLGSHIVCSRAKIFFLLSFFISFLDELSSSLSIERAPIDMHCGKCMETVDV